MARVVHAGGDATGSEVSSALAEAARVGSRVQLYENEFVIDLLTVDGRCVGALSLNLDDGGLTLNVAMVTVLATGGAGQVYGRTTNPPVATGDGMAMAYRAGAAIRDLEFVQFHPTGLAVPGQETVQLITEALRGEGAYLRNAAGERFMTRGRPARRAAPRATSWCAAWSPRCARTAPTTCTSTPRTSTRPGCRSASRASRAGLREHGLDLATQLIPVAPVCHYFIGGVVTDVWGRTTVPGLYASGEVASTGVHGANRLASNSLLEGLVFSDRVVRDLDRYIGRLGEDVRRLRFDLPEAAAGGGGSDAAAARRRLTAVMSDKVGVLRRADDLQAALAELGALTSELQFGALGEPEYELLNLLTLGTQIAKCALLREESRGVHLREDFPELDDEHWRAHLTLRLPRARARGGRRQGDAHRGGTRPDERSGSAARSCTPERRRHERAQLPQAARTAVRRALREDLAGYGDLTGSVFAGDGVARVVAREAGVLSGVAAFAATARAGRRRRSPSRSSSHDGERFAAGDAVAELRGPLAAILAAERTGLNFLCRLCGVATLTAAYVAETAGTGARIAATRKTTPGLRALEKQAVVHGGGTPHRFGLFDGAMIKDNHVAAAGGVAAAVARVRAGAAHLHALEVEVDTLEQLDEALAAGATIVLLDNMDTRHGARGRARVSPDAPLVEVSGGVAPGARARARRDRRGHHLRRRPHHARAAGSTSASTWRSDVLLVVDVGNTQTHIGVIDDGEVHDEWRIATVRHRTSDEIAGLLQGLFSLKGERLKEVIDEVGVASVVPRLTQQWEEMCEKHLGLAAFVVGPGARTGMRIMTKNPAEVGRRPHRQRRGGLRDVRRAVHRRRLRHGHHLRRHLRRGRLPGRRHRSRHRGLAGGAHHARGQAHQGRAGRARARHRQVHHRGAAVGRRVRLRRRGGGHRARHLGRARRRSARSSPPAASPR